MDRNLVVADYLGVDKERVFIITNELLSIDLFSNRLERATSFDGPERDYAMLVCGVSLYPLLEELKYRRAN
jgi:hypothetical protein